MAYARYDFEQCGLDIPTGWAVTTSTLQSTTRLDYEHGSLCICPAPVLHAHLFRLQEQLDGHTTWQVPAFRSDRPYRLSTGWYVCITIPGFDGRYNPGHIICTSRTFQRFLDCLREADDTVAKLKGADVDPAAWVTLSNNVSVRAQEQEVRITERFSVYLTRSDLNSLIRVLETVPSMAERSVADLEKINDVTGTGLLLYSRGVAAECEAAPLGSPDPVGDVPMLRTEHWLARFTRRLFGT